MRLEDWEIRKLGNWGIGPLILLLSLGMLTACNSAPPPTLMPLAALPIPTPTAEPDYTPSSLPPTSDLPTLSPPPSPSPCPEVVSPSHIPIIPPRPQVPIIPSPLPLPVYPTAPAPGARATNVELIFKPPMPSAAEILEWRPPPVPVPHSLHPNDHYWLRRPIPSGQVDWGLDWYPYGSDGGGIWHTHHGMDFPNDPGTPVLAAGDGVVIWVTGDWFPIYVEIKETSEAEEEQPPEPQPDEKEPTENPESEEEEEPKKKIMGPYGNYVIIRHNWGWQGEPVYTLYAHLLEVFVNQGDQVAAGDLIGGVGNTGNSSGPHLHFEVRAGKNDYNHTLNPALWIAPYEEWGTLAGRVTSARGTFLYNVIVTVYPTRSDQADDDVRLLTSYANNQVNPDDLWGENFVVPDLPAGEYRLAVRARGETLRANVHIRPGVTTFIKLHTGPAPARAPTRVPTSTP